MSNKAFYLSKTFWTNIILGGLALFIPWVQENITPEVMVSIFAGVNLVLRLFFTKDNLQLT